MIVTLLDPSHYVTTPWRNGGGVTVDIAVVTDQDGEVWRFGRTPIVAPGPFSDYRGFDRIQVLVAGSGLVLRTPDGDIDVRHRFRPVRFTGETPIVTRLETGPVEVVNLIGNRAKVQIDLKPLEAGHDAIVGAGTHIAYCPEGPSTIEVQGTRHDLAANHALRIEADALLPVAVSAGRLLLASIL
jgi:environmental stress-induced protein Ves